MTSYHEDLCRLLDSLGREGIELAAHTTDSTRLRHRPEMLPADLLTRLRTHKAAVLGLLVKGYKPEDDDAAYVLSERLGMADDLGQPTHVGSTAWLVAVGESMDSCCQSATPMVECGYGTTDKGHSGGGEGERPDAGSDRQRRGSSP